MNAAPVDTFATDKVKQENARLHATYNAECESARRAEVLLWKEIGRPQPKRRAR